MPKTKRFLVGCLLSIEDLNIFEKILNMVTNDQLKDLFERLGALRRYL